MLGITLIFFLLHSYNFLYQRGHSANSIVMETLLESINIASHALISQSNYHFYFFTFSDLFYYFKVVVRYYANFSFFFTYNFSVFVSEYTVCLCVCLWMYTMDI